MKSQQRCIHTLVHKASSFSFSLDGKTLISFSKNDRTAKVWDVNTGELKKTVTGLRSIALSEDGKTLAGSNDDTSINLWDIETGVLKKSLNEHSSVASFISFSSDGKTLLSRGQETIKLWDISTGELRNTIAEGFNKCSGSIFSPNGQTVAISISVQKEDGSSHSQINLWDVETERVIRTLDDNFGLPTFSNDGKTLFISCVKEEVSYTYYIDGTKEKDDYPSRKYYIQVWDLRTGEISKTLASNRFCTLSPDGHIVVGLQEENFGFVRRRINLIDVNTGQNIKSFPGSVFFPETFAALSPDGKILAVVSEDGEALKLLDWSNETPIATLTLTKRISNFAFSPDGNILALSDGENIKLWQESTELIVENPLHGDAYPHLKYLENLLAAELWEDADRETADIIKRFPAQDLNIVDRLWLHYSNGHYGFCVQKQIWESVLHDRIRRTKMNASPLSNAKQFKYCLGWCSINTDPNYHGANDEFLIDASYRTTKGYYPREFYRAKQLLEEKQLIDVFIKIAEIGSNGLS